MKSIKLTALALVVFINNQAIAQEQESSNYSPIKEFFRDVQFGGDIGFAVGNNGNSIIIAPKAVKPINQYIRAGLGANYGYHSFGTHNNTSVYGGSAIVLANPIPEIQVSAEFEQLRVNQQYTNENNSLKKYNFWNTALFLGAGYNMGNLVMGIRYNVLHRKDADIYTQAWSPFIQVFF